MINFYWIEQDHFFFPQNTFKLFFKIIVLLLLISYPQYSFSTELTSIKNKTINDFETIFSETSKGLDFTIIGESFLVDKEIKKISQAELNVSSPIKKAFLLWAGELNNPTKTAKKIAFTSPENLEHLVQANKIWKKNSSGILYTAWADVTQFVSKNGTYSVKNLSSHAINPNGKDPYTLAGWALIVITANPKAQTKNSLKILAGMQILKPGEVYDIPINLDIPNSNWELNSVGFIGGHGRAGNGSGNLVNGKSISGIDDWDGSSGKFWDIDLFTTIPETNNDKGKGLILTIDPLLQWLYPVGAVVNVKGSL